MPIKELKLEVFIEITVETESSFLLIVISQIAGYFVPFIVGAKKKVKWR